jgi:phospholipid/cholesterol/gamma-HCH transport system substrate-binding protein
MSERPEFRYVNEAVGAFVLLIVVVTAFLVFRAAWIHRLLNPGQRLTVIMPETGSFGLVKGSQAIVLGTKAGEVVDIAIRSDDRMYAVVDIREDFARFVRLDSEITIRKKYGIAGDTYLNISRGYGRPVDGEEAVLVARLDPSTTERLDAVLDDLRTKLLPTIDETRVAVRKWAEVADHLRAPERDFGPALANINTISQRLVRGEGALGRILSDDDMADDLQQIIARVNEATGQLGPILSRIDQISADAGVITGQLKEEAGQLPGLVRRLQATSAELQSFVGDLRAAGEVLPDTTRSVDEAADRLPALVLQAQEAVRDIERLAEALRERFAPDERSPELPGRRLSPEDAAP